MTPICWMFHQSRSEFDAKLTDSSVMKGSSVASYVPDHDGSRASYCWCLVITVSSPAMHAHAGSFPQDEGCLSRGVCPQQFFPLGEVPACVVRHLHEVCLEQRSWMGTSSCSSAKLVPGGCSATSSRSPGVAQTRSALRDERTMRLCPAAHRKLDDDDGLSDEFTALLATSRRSSFVMRVTS